MHDSMNHNCCGLNGVGVRWEADRSPHPRVSCHLWGRSERRFAPFAPTFGIAPLDLFCRWVWSYVGGALREADRSAHPPGFMLHGGGVARGGSLPSPHARGKWVRRIAPLSPREFVS
jgi:hypothetical protein